MTTRVAACALMLVIASCGSSVEDAPGEGAALFESRVLGGQAGCATCHSLTPDRVLVGPSLAGVGERAGNRVPGLSAEAYLLTSIVEPDAYVVEGFDSGRMPSNWGDVLSDDEIAALVDYLEGQ